MYFEQTAIITSEDIEQLGDTPSVGDKICFNKQHWVVRRVQVKPSLPDAYVLTLRSVGIYLGGSDMFWHEKAQGFGEGKTDEPK